jgi:hypothetical protein
VPQSGSLGSGRGAIFLIVSPALPGSGHVEHACEQQAAFFLCLLLDMANIRVVQFTSAATEHPRSLQVVCPVVTAGTFARTSGLVANWPEAATAPDRKRCRSARHVGASPSRLVEVTAFTRSGRAAPR